MAETLSPFSGPSTPRRRSRLPWLLVALIGLAAIAALKPVGGVFVDRGYLPATQEHGYGYIPYRKNSGSMVSQTRLFAVVLWQAEKMPVFPRTDLTVGGHHVWPPSRSRDERPVSPTAVYALQPDYTLKRIPLSSQEVNRVSALVENAKQNSRFRRNEFWQTRIEPELKLVGSEQESQPPATTPADEPSHAG
jgi:hypothetical protein